VIELKTVTPTNNKKQQNTVKGNTLKAFPKYYNEDIVVSTFSFVHFSNTSLLLMPLLHLVSDMFSVA
jgi:hypothetical protein